MSNTQDPIDTLIDQIEEHESIDTCEKCLCGTTNLVKTVCDHIICLECVETLIDDNEYNNCPICKGPLPKNLHKIFIEHLANPLNNLQYYHDMVAGDVLWFYEGNGHNWLYSKEHCIDIDEAYGQYEEDGTSDTTEIQVHVNDKIETYVINFSTLKQYPKNTPSKKRGISCFKLNSINDLKKNKIVGVAGKLL